MTMRPSVLSLATALVATVGASSAQAQTPTPVQWTATAVAAPTGKSLPKGTRAVKLVAAIEPGWHIYSITQGPGGPNKTTISLSTPSPFSLAGDIIAAPPEVSFDKNFGINVETYETAAEFTIPIKAEKTAKKADKPEVAVRYQVCNSSSCLPPRTQKLSVDLKPAHVKTTSTTQGK